MSAQKAEAIPTIDHKPHAAFFRQSGWLMLANIIAGFMSLGVHLLNKKISLAEYSIFGTMLMVTACIPDAAAANGAGAADRRRAGDQPRAAVGRR